MITPLDTISLHAVIAGFEHARTGVGANKPRGLTHDEKQLWAVRYAEGMNVLLRVHPPQEFPQGFADELGGHGAAGDPQTGAVDGLPHETNRQAHILNDDDGEPE